MTTPTTLKEVSDSIRTRLLPRYDAREAEALTRIIIEELLHYTPVDVVLRKDTIISEFKCQEITKVVDRLLKMEPIQYILGKARFYGLELAVTPAVLIPRPETEELVDMIVKDAGRASDLRVLDIATGSGCIAIALARNLRFPIVSAIDISDDALAVARGNAATLKTSITFKQADALALKPLPDQYDIIVSNPPYIADEERAAMSANVLDYEPSLALFVPDDDPLKFYRAIGKYAATALSPKGRLYFEINPRFVDELKSMLVQFGLIEVTSVADFTDRQRFVTAKSPEFYD
jgi:release factor glutamine methyltransferase